MQTLSGEGLERGVADVHLEEALEEPGGSSGGAEDAVANEWRAVHEQQAAGHSPGKALDAAVSLLIEVEVVGAERVGQSGGLTKTEGHAFACDRIDGPGGVADEGDDAMGYAEGSASERGGTARRAGGVRCGQVTPHSGAGSGGVWGGG